MQRRGKLSGHTWEEAIEILRGDPQHQERIFDSYLTADLLDNCRRFFEGGEFREVLSVLERHAPGAKRVLDMPGGNGIATYGFAKCGFDVATVEPDPSHSVGRGAIAQVLKSEGLHAHIVAAFGEKLPFATAYFDVVYVRQGLHHARDLASMTSELARVLRPGGILLACREHVIDNYGRSLEAFLASQPDHQLYGGENAFTLTDYRSAIIAAGFQIVSELGPFDSIINMFPKDHLIVRKMILESVPGRALSLALSPDKVTAIGMWMVKRRKSPGRLFSFLARKPE